MEPKVSGSKQTTQSTDIDTTRAIARMPGLEIEIEHRRFPEADREQISINLTATPSFEAFGHFFEAANPFVFWANAMRLAWLPWLNAARAIEPPPRQRREA
jgi:hypothetical protein